MGLVLNICELNKFIDRLEEFNQDKDDELIINGYRFDPISEKATMSKGDQSVVIDLTLSVDDQLSEFQIFLGGL